MKVMSLNIWGGRVAEPLLDFFVRHGDMDLFCLQEVYCQATQQMSTEGPVYHLDILSEIEERLPFHNSYFRPIINDSYGIAMLVHERLQVLDEGAIVIHDNPDYIGRGPTHPRIMQWVKVSDGEQTTAVLNVHGLWNGKGKTDSLERISQSEKIVEFVRGLDIPVVLCGDFNLRPDTESIRMLETVLDNQIRKQNITSTRTALYPKEEKFADYVFTSDDLEIKEFRVLPDEVSDHAALVVDVRVRSVVMTAPEPHYV